ncbi:hypothetical protein CGQ24_08270 [Arthrobacter sp. 7749]|nr:hypothetical protein CGQ24_08270 [Arthrobacter sp. 7749]
MSDHLPEGINTPDVYFRRADGSILIPRLGENMPITREARYLSGADLGKTFIVAPDQERTIQEINHYKQGCWILSSTEDGRRWKNHYEPTATATITVTGTPSPPTNNNQ